MDDLDLASTRKVLESGIYADAVRADRRLAGEYGVTKIPTYVVDRQPPIHGAKRTAILVDALRAAATSAPD